MTDEVRERIGEPPVGVATPFWAWHTYDWKRKHADLRGEGYRHFDEPHVCLTLELPEKRVLLSDFESWHFPLMVGILVCGEYG